MADAMALVTAMETEQAWDSEMECNLGLSRVADLEKGTDEQWDIRLVPQKENGLEP
jgi:hypothetical protein